MEEFGSRRQELPPPEARRQWDEKLNMALDIGEQMMLSGAEVSRVEDSERRLCMAFGAVRVDVLCITASLIVTIYAEEYGSVTQSRRIHRFSYDMNRLDRMNDLSRRICEQHLTVEQAREQYREIMAEKPYPFRLLLGASVLVAFSFSLFFGGSFRDALIAGLIAVPFKYLADLSLKYDINGFFTVLVSALIGGCLAILAVQAGAGDSVGMISIGDVMLLIPGIVLTNSIRDMFGGDTITGGIRFLEASLTAVAIALGFTVAALFLDRLFPTPAVSTARNWSPFASAAVELASSIAAAVGCGVQFRVPKKKILPAGLGGLVGWAVYLAAGFLTPDAAVRYFLAAVVITYYAEWMARRAKSPATVFLVSAIMPLVPGGMLYETMSAAVKQDWTNFGKKGVSTLLIAIAIALGILVTASYRNIMRKLRERKSG